MSGCGCLDFAPDDKFIAAFGFGAAALRYADMGYAVLPLARGGKRPHRMLGDQGGVHHATRDRGRIQYWWVLDPAANIGVACGSRSRLAVVDLDVKHDKDGPAVFAQFMTGSAWGARAYVTQQAFPGAPVAITASGGYHLWLHVPGGAQVPDRNGILPGVDVKGDGGYVVAAPSMIITLAMDRPGEYGSAEVPIPYRWVSGCPHAAPPVPDWLLHWLRTAPALGNPAGNDGRGERRQGSETEKPVPAPGNRNETYYREACRWFRLYGGTPAGDENVMEQLRELYDRMDTSGFSRAEAARSAESARMFIESQRQLEDPHRKEFLAWLASRRSQ